MKYVRALEYVLENAPVRAKDPDKKVEIFKYLKTFKLPINNIRDANV